MAKQQSSYLGFHDGLRVSNIQQTFRFPRAKSAVDVAYRIHRKYSYCTHVPTLSHDLKKSDRETLPLLHGLTIDLIQALTHMQLFTQHNCLV